MTEVKAKKLKGFAAMDPEKQKAISSKGGKAVPRYKRIYAVNRKLASEAGRKGGMAAKRKKSDAKRDETAVV